jgi:hypothetical protein
VPNKATIERELRARQGLQAALDGGPLPLDVIRAQMNGNPHPATGEAVTRGQFEAAVAAAPYCHPKAVIIADAKDRVTGVLALPDRQAPTIDAVLEETTEGSGAADVSISDCDPPGENAKASPPSAASSWQASRDQPLAPGRTGPRHLGARTNELQVQQGYRKVE